jgi:hypothetical protein
MMMQIESHDDIVQYFDELYRFVTIANTIVAMQVLQQLFSMFHRHQLVYDRHNHNIRVPPDEMLHNQADRHKVVLLVREELLSD